MVDLCYDLYRFASLLKLVTLTKLSGLINNLYIVIEIYHWGMLLKDGNLC